MHDAPPHYRALNLVERHYWTGMLSWDRQRLHDVIRDREKPPEQRTAAKMLLNILSVRHNREF
jgi:hypothetical protein